MSTNAWSRFWDEFEVSAAQLSVFRVLFFGVLAIDCWLQVSHAPRYGFGGFNVSHHPVFDWLLPAPGRALLTVAWVVQSILAFRIAFGARDRGSIGLLAVLYGACYFSSQLDSYQHHYLVFLVLLLCWVVPFGAKDAQARWPVRLILVQLSIMYFFASLNKFEGGWIDGTPLSLQITKPDWIVSAATSIGWDTTALMVAVGELSLAVALQVRKLRVFAAIGGMALHLSIEVVGFDIGLFSYLMFGLYALVLPPQLFDSIASRFKWRPRVPNTSLAMVVAISVAASGLLLLLPFGAAPAVATALTVVFALTRRQARFAAAHIAAVICVLVLLRNTDTTFDYYRYWGGAARMFGNTEEAIQAYSKLVEVAPNRAGAHRRLGRVLMPTQPERARTEFQRAIEIDPQDSSSKKMLRTLTTRHQ